MKGTWDGLYTCPPEVGADHMEPGMRRPGLLVMQLMLGARHRAARLPAAGSSCGDMSAAVLFARGEIMLTWACVSTQIAHLLCFACFPHVPMLSEQYAQAQTLISNASV